MVWVNVNIIKEGTLPHSERSELTSRNKKVGDFWVFANIDHTGKTEEKWWTDKVKKLLTGRRVKTSYEKIKIGKSQ